MKRTLPEVTKKTTAALASVLTSRDVNTTIGVNKENYGPFNFFDCRTPLVPHDNPIAYNKYMENHGAQEYMKLERKNGR